MPAPQKRPKGRCDALSLNMRAIASTPLLSAAEEIWLARQVQKGRQLRETKEEITLRSGGVAPSETAWALEAGMTQRQLKRCLHRAERARSRMVLANLRLVISLARRYPHRPGELEDLIQEGNRLVMMTNGPAAGIGEVLTIPFPRPRSREDIMEDPLYYEMRNQALDFLYNRFAHDEDET